MATGPGLFTVVCNHLKPTMLLRVARPGRPVALRTEAEIVGNKLSPIKPGSSLGSLSSTALRSKALSSSAVPLFRSPK